MAVAVGAPAAAGGGGGGGVAGGAAVGPDGGEVASPADLDFGAAEEGGGVAPRHARTRAAEAFEEPPDTLWEPGGWRPSFLPPPASDAVAHADGVPGRGEAEDSEGEEQFVLDARPFGLEIGPAPEAGVATAAGCAAACGGKGGGAVVREVAGRAATAGVEPGSRILSINEQPVEDLSVADIQGRLDEVPLPLTLGLSPGPLNLPSASTRRKVRRAGDRVTVCTAHCRSSYRVVREAIARLGWREITTEARDASVIWLEHSDPTEGLAPVQTTSRLEAFLSFCRKARLAQSLNAWVDHLPDEFAFSPRTWVLPCEATELEVAMNRHRDTYIAKPTCGSQGKGIVLVRKFKDLSDIIQKCKSEKDPSGVRQYVVQRYISRPLLLDGLKFDLRLYVVVTSVVPLRAYLFKEGLARFCTVPYHPPKESNLQDACMHLTNYALNKKSKDFQAVEGVAEGSKRSASAVFRQIETTYGSDSRAIWGKVASLVANTLLALRPGLLEYYVHERPKALHPLGPKAFQIIGLDVIIDSDQEPRLLELNANPSLSVAQPGTGPENALDLDGSGGAGGASAAGPLSLEAVAAAAAAAAASSSAAPSSVPALAPALAPGALARSTSLGPPAAALVAAMAAASGEPLGGAGAATKSGAGVGERGSTRRSRSLRAQSRQRLGLAGAIEAAARELLTSGSEKATSELDLEVKRELVCQALLLPKPAPQTKVARLRRQWQEGEPRSGQLDAVPLDDGGAWVAVARPMRAEAVRPDAPERCPAMEALDFEALAAAEVAEYAQAHLALYRCWRRSCGASQDTLGQERMLKLIERGSLIGAGGLFPDKVTAQIWFSRIWRDVAEGAFGLRLHQFVRLVGRLGRMLAEGPAALAADAAAEDADGSRRIEGVLEFVRRGLADEAAPQPRQ